MNTRPIVFLFDADADGVSGSYGGHFDQAFLAALSEADPNGTAKTTILRGDAMPSQLATKITAVSASDRRSGHTESYAADTYQMIIWDFADALATQWHTVDTETFPVKLARRNIYCIGTPTLADDLVLKVDAGLRSCAGYLGAVELDLGNPVQTGIFIRFLTSEAVIADGQVILELSFEGYPEVPFYGADDFRPHGERRVAYGELHDLKPPIPFPTSPSPRGQLSLERYQGKRRFSLQERVANALTRVRTSKDQSPYSFTVSDDPANPLEANLPEAKFIRYLLDETHPKGKDKAKFFRDALGIGPDDWRYLAAQFHDGLKSADLTEMKVKGFADTFGASFNAVIPVKGLNGRTIPIDTNWIMEPGQQPRLSTAVPAKPHDNAGEPSAQPPVVAADLKGDDRWSAIYALAAEAGRRAAEEATPTPMKIVGGPIIMDGACGFAWVRVPDARRGFAKWVISTGHGNRHYQTGAQVFADVQSQSIDRARAYATAFAAVLKHNGIYCFVESRLD